jgi:hypothetical protein
LETAYERWERMQERKEWKREAEEARAQQREAEEARAQQQPADDAPLDRIPDPALMEYVDPQEPTVDEDQQVLALRRKALLERIAPEYRPGPIPTIGGEGGQFKPIPGQSGGLNDEWKEPSGVTMDDLIDTAIKTPDAERADWLWRQVDYSKPGVYKVLALIWADSNFKGFPDEKRLKLLKDAELGAEVLDPEAKRDLQQERSDLQSRLFHER